MGAMIATGVEVFFTKLCSESGALERSKRLMLQGGD